MFLECYGRAADGDGAGFLTFSRKMRGYGKKVSTLTGRQHDRFVHSVNVLLFLHP